MHKVTHCRKVSTTLKTQEFIGLYARRLRLTVDGFWMANPSVKLSANGLANIPAIPSRNDFEFVVGGSHYCCPSFVADFLSLKVARIHAADPTVDKFVNSIEDRQGGFDSFLSLGRSSTLSISSSNRNFLLFWERNSRISNSSR